jgi:hypothetical protein
MGIGPDDAHAPAEKSFCAAFFKKRPLSSLQNKARA